MASTATQDALTAHADNDATALSDEIRRLLVREGASSDSAEEQEERAVVANVVEHLQTRPASTVHAVATVLVSVAAAHEEKGGEGESAVITTEQDDSAVVTARQWDLLNGLLQQAKQRLGDATERAGEEQDDEKQSTLPMMLVAYAERIATELTRSEPAPARLKMLVVWADMVVDLAVRIPADTATEEAVETADATATSWVVRLVGEFFRIHQHSPAIQTDVRVMTLVWKNLNKLSAVHRTTILALGGGDPSVQTDGITYSFNAAFEAAAVSLARTTQRLRTTTTAYADQEIASELRLLRLFLRAFQGQFIQFVDGMVAQFCTKVECSVALAVDAVAAVIPIAEALVITESEKTQHEAIRVLQCVISLVETMARSDKLQASTRSFVGTLLWQPRDKMITLVEQMRSQYVDAEESATETSEAFLEWGHVLALAAFHAAHGDDNDAPPSSADETWQAVSIVPEFIGVATLFTRFRTWGGRVLVGEFPKSMNLFVDIVLDSLVAQARATAPLQLFLVEQTLHPNPTQRFLVWELWRELMCFVWEEAVVRAAFDTLLELTYTKNGKGGVLQADVREEIMGLLAYIYPELCGAVKEEYLRVGSSAFEVVCAEGPGHKLTPQLASSFDLLELLATSSLLVDYDLPDKEDWIAHHLPVAMECLGGVHDFLDQGQPMRLTERCGVLRVLDAGLLVVRAIFEDNDKDEVRNAHGLGSMVLPMCAETVTHLAKLVQLSNGDDGTSSLVSARSFTRVLRNCLEILTVLSPLVKANHSNQCAQLIKDLLAILQSDHELTPHAVAIAIFIRDALGDMWIMSSDADIVWKMLGSVFYKLSALHFGLQVDPTMQPLTPPQTVCLEAIYALMGRSNLPDFANRNRNFKSWVVPHAQPRFAKFIQMMCMNPQAAEGVKMAHCGQWYRSDRVDAIHRLRYPSVHNRDEDQPSRKRDREEHTTIMRVESPPPGAGDVDMDQEIETAKRIKWDAFAATYWQLHESLSSLSSPDLQEAFLDRLTEGDLDQATSALQALLRKNPIQ